MKKMSLLAVVFFFLCFNNISAKEYPSIYKGIRPMGMGGAFVAVSNDSNALFYNPAGLADITERRVSLLNLGVEFGRKAYNTIKDARGVDFEDESETAGFLRDHIGEYSHVGANLVPFYSRPNFAFALIGTTSVNLQARNRQYPKLVIDAVGDAGAAIGYAHAFLDNTLLVGASGKFITRKSLDKEYSVLDITTDDFNDKIDNDTEDGIGGLLDLGLIYLLKDIQISTKNVDFRFGISAANLGNNDMGDAKNIDDHIDLGFAANIDNWMFALDYVDVFTQMNVGDEDATKRIRIGAEYAFKPYLLFRFGFYQGYTTFGIGLNKKNVQFDLLSYAEEVAAYSGQRSDRRYALRLGLGF